ncbi:hypothetical protein [Geodermatophilus sp. CPCC 205761]|uniref:hypothetical protein n=1 Tax=Geodermatophilus sp. CPCC 205761 TaxID=2936597 RepID=UPI003EEAB6B0
MRVQPSSRAAPEATTSAAQASPAESNGEAPAASSDTSAQAAATESQTPTTAAGYFDRFRTWSDIVLGGGGGLAVFLADDRWDILSSMTAPAAGVIALGGGLAISDVRRRQRAAKAAEEAAASAAQVREQEQSKFLKGLSQLRSQLDEEGHPDLAERLRKDLRSFELRLIDLPVLKRRAAEIQLEWETRPTPSAS